MPRKMSGEQERKEWKVLRVFCYVNAQEKREIEERARREGVSVSVFIRRALGLDK